MTLRRLLLIAVLTLMALCSAYAEAPRSRSIRIIGRENLTITTPEIRLGDVAEVISTMPQDDDAVIGLQKIYLERSPAPGAELTIAASSVLQTLAKQGVDFERIAYTFPRIMTVRRAGRILSAEEVREAIERSLSQMSAEVVLKEVRYQGDRTISPGPARIEALPLSATNPGLRPFTINIRVNGEAQQPFEVTALVDEWAIMPVAKRPVARGTLIAADDVVMARVNLAAIPADALRNDEDVIGLEVNRDIPFGEVFRRDKLTIPPLINAGSRVTMVYKRGPFEASASGVALESGIRGQEIKVRNDTSKKVISGVVLEAGVIGVRP